MGMFDDIKFHYPCPVCGNESNSYQSKDKDCILDMLEPIDVNNFYTFCHGCDAWIDFKRVKDSIYEMTVQVKNKVVDKYTKQVDINNVHDEATNKTGDN